MRERTSLFALNKGLISKLGLGRVDIKRLALGAETMTNWLPRVLGPMTLRPGFKYLGATYGSAAARYIPHIFATDDCSLVELTAGLMRIWIEDELLTRPAVDTAVANGSFTSNVTSWTDSDEAGATSSWNSSGYLELVGNGTARAMRDQTVTVGVDDRGIEHALRVVIARGPVYIRVGSTSGGDEYVTETKLGTGIHSLSFTPTSDFYIRFFSSQIPSVYVNSCTIESSGVVTLTTPWLAADLSDIRFDQSGDVLYIACDGYQQRVIERRGTRPNARSWSIALYQPPDGPFLVQNTGPTTLTPSALTGNITLTASKAMFKSTHVGALFSVTSEGQAVEATASADNGATASIRVTGIDSERVFSIAISGNASSSTVDLQRSFDDATWANVATQQWTADVSTTFDDSLDNQIVYYRLILTTRVAPDDVTMTLRIGSGSIRGIARVTAYTSSTVVSAEVLSAMGGTTANDVWQEGQWSDVRGWPSAVCFHDGRLWWAGKNGIWGSVSDAFDSFDETVIGDSGPLNRTIGSGPVDKINWLLSLQRLVVGTQGAEMSARSSSLDEPLTPTAFSMKACSTQGSGNVPAVNVDQMGYFVNRSGIRVFELSTDIRSTDYQATDMLQLNPELGVPGIVRMAVQRQPDTRLHCVRSDGVVILGVMNRAEEVTAWVQIETDGDIEDVVVLPAVVGDVDDQVYYVVKRTINGATVRYLEKWAQEMDCRGDDLSYLADSFVEYTGTATTSITGLDHLELEEVVVWADGEDVGTDSTARPWTHSYTVTGGAITLATAASNVVVGLPYTARFKSAKLGSLTQAGSPLNTMKQIKALGLLLADTHELGLKFGQSFDDGDMDDLPRIEEGTTPTGGDYDHDMIPFPGRWSTEARICLEAVAPRHATVVAVTLDLESH